VEMRPVTTGARVDQDMWGPKVAYGETVVTEGPVAVGPGTGWSSVTAGGDPGDGPDLEEGRL